MSATVELRGAVGHIAWPAVGSRALRLQPGWPLSLLFVGYPLWWLLGLSQIMNLVVAVMMALQLARRRSVFVPAAFGVWLLFLAWTLTGPLVAQVVAPGAEPDVELTHYFTWAYRMSFFVVATVAVVYVATLRLSPQRIGRILSVMFLVVVGGGLLGVLASHLSFPSAVELMLPQRFDANIFIHAQVHPTPAELQNYLGRVNARPSAPFAYANEWGLNYAVLLPFFVGTWLAPDAGWRRVAGFGVLAISVVPVVYSLNRGLWAALVLSLAFVALRSALAGHLRLVAAACVVVAVLPVAILASPLRAHVEARFSGHTSNEGRANLQTLAVTSTAQRSPVVGFGATRRVQGSFHSIAEGATPQCPKCSPPALGTQGQLWTVTFSFGLFGAALFVGFLGLSFLRHLRQRSPTDTMCLTVMLVYLVTLPIYDFSYPALIALMSAIAVLGRDRVRRTTLGDHVRFLVAQRWVVGGAVVVGLAAGSLLQVAARPIYHASASVVVPLAVLPSQEADPVTLDELAQQVTGSTVVATIAAAVHATPAAVRDALVVTATPNSRILHLNYTAASAATARRGAEAATAALLEQQRETLAAQQARDVRSLAETSDRLTLALREVRMAEHVQGTSVLVARTLEGALVKQATTAQRDRFDAASRRVDPGAELGAATVRHDTDGWRVLPISGAMLGLLAGVGLARWRRSRWVRLSAAVRSGAVAGTRILATVDPRHDPALPALRVQAYLSVDRSPQTLRVTALLDRGATLVRPNSRAGSGSSRRTVVLVASRRARLVELTTRLAELRAASVPVSGLVLVDDQTRRIPTILIRPSRGESS